MIGACLIEVCSDNKVAGACLIEGHLHVKLVGEHETACLRKVFA